MYNIAILQNRMPVAVSDHRERNYGSLIFYLVD